MTNYTRLVKHFKNGGMTEFNKFFLENAQSALSISTFNSIVSEQEILLHMAKKDYVIASILQKYIVQAIFDNDFNFTLNPVSQISRQQEKYLVEFVKPKIASYIKDHCILYD